MRILIAADDIQGNGVPETDESSKEREAFLSVLSGYQAKRGVRGIYCRRSSLHHFLGPR